MTVVKICGITSETDTRAAVQAGADCLGFNFYAKSPRCIDARVCMQITDMLAREHPAILKIGVFVNMPVLQILAVMQSCQLDLAQLHGDEGPDELRQLGPRAFKAYRGIPTKVNGYLRNDPPACLVDASVNGAYGGTGITADWSAAAELAVRFPMFLAGGLTPDNVADAIWQVKPWGVDTASGVESRPGVKDAGKMREFVHAVRGV